MTEEKTPDDFVTERIRNRKPDALTEADKELRDRFAMAALTALVSEDEYEMSESWVMVKARAAYQYAQAMMKARSETWQRC